ncbi:unnamed protein product [Nippostrongylus brasiliensis]|uniref:G_PROTEIN_RECEP_F1_2 domain-containing protein n=1 Tax=Nippostrongylus brasiliensis TaxID=27835 RepID=A0A0N4XTN5_NIPBR|nr:unnamed protein product [Nippostrongylus brasiliensis]
MAEINSSALLVLEKICFAYWTFTVPFYTLVVVCMIHAQLKKATDLDSPFFKLCITTGFIDIGKAIVALLNNYIGAVFPKWGWFTDVYIAIGKPYLYVYFIISWGTDEKLFAIEASLNRQNDRVLARSVEEANQSGKIVNRKGHPRQLMVWAAITSDSKSDLVFVEQGINQALSVSLLASNRLSALLFPQRHRTLWQGRRLKLAMFIQIVPGFLVSLHNLTNEVVFTRTENGDGKGVQRDRGRSCSESAMPALEAFTARKKTTAIYFTVGGCVLAVNTLYLIVAYCYLLYILRKRHQSQLKHHNSRNRSDRKKSGLEKREFRLFLMASSIVTVQLFIVAFFSIKLMPVFRITMDVFYTFYNALK